MREIIEESRVFSEIAEEFGGKLSVYTHQHEIGIYYYYCIQVYERNSCEVNRVVPPSCK